MSTLRISDAPLLPDVDGTEKIPTGGRGDYAISVDQIKGHIFQDIGKELVGLGNVDNTSDLDKPVSTAQQVALDLKADKTYVDNNLDLKADKTNVYTRSETTLALSTKADLVGGVIPSNQLPSYVDDVVEYTTNTLPIVGESGKIYITTDTNRTWRWSGNQYVEISNGGVSDSTLKLQTPRKIANVDFDGTQNINIPHNNLINRDVSGAHIASAITDDGGTNLQDLSDNLKRGVANKFSSYIALSGGYAVGDRVLLDDGRYVVSNTANNTTNPNIQMTGWDVFYDKNLFAKTKLVDTRLYGLKVNSEEDQTAAIHAAFAANPTNNNFYIPTGVVKANIVYPRAYINLVGDGMLNTTIEPFDLTKPAISYGKRLYPGLIDIQVQADQLFTGEQLIDARDTRYILMENTDVRKIIRNGQTHQYQTILIDNRCVVNTWTGYNKFRNVRGTYGAYGYLSDVDKLNSVPEFSGCLFAFNGYFNIKTSTSNGTFINIDNARGGMLQPAGTYDETQYGGMYIHGNNSVILGIWEEFNAQASKAYNANNLYIQPGSKNITHNYGRDVRGTNGVRVYNQSQFELQDVNTADQSLDDGQGRSRPLQLAKNGNFKHWDAVNNRPKHWGGYFSGTWSMETSDLPRGYNTGLKVVSNVAGICGIYDHIYNPADLSKSYIKDISKWVGREITVTLLIKNIGTLDTAIRAGISTDTTNIYFQLGVATAVTNIGSFQRIHVRYTVTGNEPRIAFGCRVAGVGEGFIVTGFSVSDDIRVTDAQPATITEDGGRIFSGLDVDGQITQNGQALINRPAQSGTNGLLSAATAINTTDKYIGKQVFNTTNSLMYYATGTTPTSPWKSFDSTNTITPV